MHRQSRIADASQLEFRIVHRKRHDRLVWLLLGVRIGGQNDDSLNRSLVSPAGDGGSTASQWRRYPKAGITRIGLAARIGSSFASSIVAAPRTATATNENFPNPALQPRAGSRVGVLKKATKGSRWGPRDAASYRRSLRPIVWGRTGNRGSCGAAIGNRE
jgi:hypothetical protein